MVYDLVILVLGIDRIEVYIYEWVLTIFRYMFVYGIRIFMVALFVIILDLEII